MKKQELIDFCKFYKEYGFFPDERKKGVKMLSKRIKELRSIKVSNSKSIHEAIAYRQMTLRQDNKNFQKIIKNCQKLKEKIQKDLKNEQRKI